MKLKVPVIKNKIYEIYINDLNSEGQGVGKIDGFTVFVEKALPNEYIKIIIVKVKKNFAYGKIIEFLSKSKYRRNEFCENAKMCGGCQIQHLNYEGQLNFKRKKVFDCIQRISKIDNIYIDDIVGMNNNLNYRNKGQFPIGLSEKNLIDIGFYAKRSHNIININKCYLQHSINDIIIKLFREFMIENNIRPYDENTHTGDIRHLLTKVGFKTNEIMICIIGNCKKMPFKDKLINKFKVIKNIKSIVFSENMNKTNVILGSKITTIYGRDYIIDYIGDIKFKISALSFFQVNPIQTEKIYNKVIELADLKGNEIVFDLYCGIGTISLFFAKKAKKVIGIEVIKEAINDAKINAKINNFDNVIFELGKAEDIFSKLYEVNNIKPDIIVVDPPRKGCDIDVINTIIKIKPKKVIYISCEPSTMARDLKYLYEAGFCIKNITPFDQFPHTYHVESVTLLEKIY